MDTAIQTITFLTLLLAFAVVTVASAITGRRRTAARRRGIAEANIAPLRQNDAYDMVPTLIGQAVEADRPVLFSTGAGSLGDGSTLVTLAGTALTYGIAQEATIGETPPVFLTSDTAVIPLGYDVLSRAYQSRGVRSRTQIQSVRWYPAGDRSLVFAAMLTATVHSDQPAATVFVGRFGEELALPLLAAQREGVPIIAGSDTLTGQAVAYAMADGPLIGEDLFSAPGYIGDGPSGRGALTAQDTLRGLLILVIILIALNVATDGQLGRVVSPLLNALGS